MTTSWIIEATITDVGITSIIHTGSEGPQINVNGFRIGSDSIAEGAHALPGDTDVDNFVYQGLSSQIKYTIIDTDTVMWTVMLDTSVGNFDVGNIGITLEDGTLFAKAAYPTKSSKYMSNPPTTVGNVKIFKILMRLANVAGMINLTIIESTDSNVPEVPTELNLPPALSSLYDLYMVDNHTQIGVPTTALRLNGNWFHIPHRINPGQGQGVITTSPAKFDSSAPALGPVCYNNSTELFSAADGINTATTLVGIRTSTFEITTIGLVLGTVCGVSGSMTPNTLYYVGTGVHAGSLVTVVTGNPIAIAVSATELYIFSVLPPNYSIGTAINNMLSSYWATVLSATTTSPPINPMKGDLYLIPANATGAWSGQTNLIAQWDGTSWTFRLMPIKSMIGVTDANLFLEFLPSGWRSLFATIDEHLTGTSTSLFTNPAGVEAMIGHAAVNLNNLAFQLFDIQ